MANHFWICCLLGFSLAALSYLGYAASAAFDLELLSFIILARRAGSDRLGLFLWTSQCRSCIDVIQLESISSVMPLWSAFPAESGITSWATLSLKSCSCMICVSKVSARRVQASSVLNRSQNGSPYCASWWLSCLPVNKTTKMGILCMGFISR